MLRFTTDDFIRTASQIGQVFTEVQNGRIPRPETMQIINASLTVLEPQCVALGLTSTVAQIRRVRETVSRVINSDVPLPVFTQELMQVSIRMTDELEERKIFILSVNESSYFDASQFSAVVSARFPEAAFDIDEAGKCFAFGRSTACVFHLMRATEVVLKEIASYLGITDHAPSWEPIIRKIDSELKTKYEDRKFKGSTDLLASMSTHLHAVKVAWRNTTMHVDKKHTPDEANEIYQATRGLLRYVAENLPAKQERQGLGIVQAIRGKLKS